MTSIEHYRGRGAVISPASRYDHTTREALYDDLTYDADTRPPKTIPKPDESKSIIVYNQSPDLPFDRSINVYRGCEHGCAYCYARPGHAWLGYSPGIDFETRLFYKKNAVALLRRELGQKNYRCSPIAIGSYTDTYQPIERTMKLTADILCVLNEYSHPACIITKSGLIERDIGILAEMAERDLIHVMVTVTTLDAKTSMRLEPRAPSPKTRLNTIKVLCDHGIPTGAMIAPIIPVITEHETEGILDAVHDVGARDVFYALLRLPHELASMFEAWLRFHYPDTANHVLNRIRQDRGGKLYRSDFGKRFTGSGVLSDLTANRFSLKKKKLGFPGLPTLDCSRYDKDGNTPQMSLF